MQLSCGNDFQPNQLSSKQSMALLSRHFAGCMSRLARPCLPRYVHRIPAAFTPLHRSTEKIAHNSNRRCHSRASFGAETETDSKQSVTVRPAMLSELDDVAWLRAEAFYEVTLRIHFGQRSNERWLNLASSADLDMAQDTCGICAGSASPAVCWLLQAAVQGAGGAVSKRSHKAKTGSGGTRLRLFGGHRRG